MAYIMIMIEFHITTLRSLLYCAIDIVGLAAYLKSDSAQSLVQCNLFLLVYSWFILIEVYIKNDFIYMARSTLHLLELPTHTITLERRGNQWPAHFHTPFTVRLQPGALLSVPQP